MSLEDTVAIYSPYVIKIDGKIVDINESEVSFSSIPLTTNRFQKNYLQKKTFQVPCLNIKILQRRKSDKMPFVKEYIMLRPEEGTLRDKLKTEIIRDTPISLFLLLCSLNKNMIKGNRNISSSSKYYASTSPQVDTPGPYIINKDHKDSLQRSHFAKFPKRDSVFGAIIQDETYISNSHLSLPELSTGRHNFEEVYQRLIEKKLKFP